VTLHRRPKPVSRTRTSVFTAAAATVVALSAQSSAQAAPKPTLSQAKAEVAADRLAADAASNQYDTAQGNEQALQQKVNFLQEGIAQMQGTINTEFGQLSAVAAAQYRNDEVDPTMQLMLSSNPTQFLDEASAQGELDASQQAALTQLTGQQAVLAREKAEATAELAQQQALLKQMQQAKATGMAKLAQAQQVLQALTPAQQVQVNGGGMGGNGPAGGCGNDCGSDLGYDGTTSTASIDLSGISPEAATAMRAAMSVMGDPYLWGGAGPNAFDCSGLVMWAYAHAGITLPHSAAGDESMGTEVSYSDMQVGDIVVVDGGAHVGLYAGNGMLLNAPATGWVVELMPLTDFGPIDAIRRV
jgi:cell wall-associated NlpC family hydrolase